MKQFLMRRIASRLTPNHGLLTLAAFLLACDHMWTQRTWAALALVAGVLIQTQITPRVPSSVAG